MNLNVKISILIICLTFSIISLSQEVYDKLIPSDFYPIMTWDFVDQEDSLEDLVNCNFTVAGFVNPQDMSRTEKLGLKVFVDVDLGVQGRNKHRRIWRDRSNEEIDYLIKKLVDNGGVNKSILGYFIMDEPSSLDFAALGKAVKAVKKYAPDKLSYINLFPNYATISTLDQLDSQLGTSNYTEYLERYVQEVQPQFISYDNYMVQYSMDLKNIKRARSYMDNLLEVRRIAQKYGLPYWNIVSAHQIRRHTTIPSMANLLFQAYTSLAAGYNGITWYQFKSNGYQYSAIDSKAHKTTTYYYLKEVNRQILSVGNIINGMKSTNVYFTAPIFDREYENPNNPFIESVKCDSPLMVGEFESDSGESYAIVVNLSLEQSVVFSLSTKIKENKIYKIAPDVDDKMKDMNNHQNPLWLTAGAGVLLKIENN